MKPGRPQAKGVVRDERSVPDVRVDVDVPTAEADRTFADEAGEAGMVAARRAVQAVAAIDASV